MSIVLALTNPAAMSRPTQPPKRKGRPPIPISEQAQSKYQRACTWTSKGMVTIPLCDVLAILGYRIRYSEDQFAFHDAGSGDVVFVSVRGETCRTAWDALRERGVFQREDFDLAARAFTKTQPVKE